MYWEIKKKLCDSLYWDNHFISVVWNQTLKISKICLYRSSSECEVVSHCGAFFLLAALGLYCCTGAFSSCVEWGLLSLQVESSAQAALVAEHRLQGVRAQRCGSQELGHRAQWLAHGLGMPWHGGYSWTRDWTPVPCIDRWILNQRTTREAPSWGFCLNVY